MSKRTVIMLRGVAGVGKTALTRTLLDGDAHLVGLPILREAIAQGCGLWGQSEAPYLIADTCQATQAVVAECAGRFRIVHMWLFASPWLVEARRRVRYQHYPDDPTQAILAAEVTDAGLVDYALTVFADRPEVETVLVDANDLPLREVNENEARTILDSAHPGVQLPSPESMYQQALWIGGECYGTADVGRRDWERRRLDAILPADMIGQKLLDVGAANGGFCYEAIHRGAIHATAVEVDSAAVAMIRHVRDAFRLPLTTCRMDVVAENLPRLSAHQELLRYDVGLLLNVLHHCADPEWVLAKVLFACNSAIVEAPFGIGNEPYRGGLDPYPNAMVVPPAWVAAVAHKCGFALTAIEVSEMCPGQRLIFRLERDHD